MPKEPEAKASESAGKAHTRTLSTQPTSQTPYDPQGLVLQRMAGNRAVTELLQPNSLKPAEPVSQRKPVSGTGEGALEQQAERVETAVAKEPAAGKALLVEDDVQSLQPGQMHKTEFLNALKTRVCTAADEELKGTMWSTMGCPYVERWVNVYANKDSSAVERALHKYAPETQSASSAEQYIPLVTQKVRKGVAVWRKTGEVTDVPPEFAQGGMPGATFEGLVGAGLSALGGLVGKAVSAIGSGIASIGRALFKGRSGGAREGGDVAGIQAQLQGGHPLDAEVRGKMETAFGRDFSGVRVHADSGTAQLAGNLNARAFTVGQNVAFGADEYRPGTLIGDALIAHELAHVVQQGNGQTRGAQTKGAAYDALEEDADVAAAGAVASQFSGTQWALREVGRNALPRLVSGLRLQRCSSKKYVTNVGHTVEDLWSGAPPGTPDRTETQADAELSAHGLLSKVTKIRPPSNSYDCHGYTFLNGDRWINDDQVDKILVDNGYSVTASPAVGDIVIYRNSGGITHSGVIIAVSGGAVTKVRSKWGRLGLYEHKPNDVPAAYGSWTAYTTLRQGGHRLRETK